jgi:hypothetical protein
MASGSERRSRSDLAILGIVLLIVVALLIWFVTGRAGGDDGGVDIDVNVPGAPAPGNGSGG